MTPENHSSMNTQEKKPMSIRTKLWLSLMAIAAVLFVSGTVSIIEFGRLSDYVSQSLLEDLEGMKAAERLGNICHGYYSTIFSEVGSADSLVKVSFDQKAALERCDSAAQVLSVRGKGAAADSIQVRFSDFAQVSQQLDSVIVSNFADARAWYFDILKPVYAKLIYAIEMYRIQVNDHMMVSADEFQQGFYRAIIPGVVITGVGLILIFLLLFYMLVYYVRPLRMMLGQLKGFNREGLKKYHVDFDGEDELSELNDNIRDLADENIQLKRRLRMIDNEDK